MPRRRPTTKVLASDARRHHRAMLLQQLFDHGPRSRADLARHSGLTRVTVSDLVAELLTDGLVTELGTRPGVRQGKPATLIGLRDDGPVVIAIDLSGSETFVGALIDLHGQVITRHREPAARAETAVDAVLAITAALQASTTRPILGVGIGTPGIVSPDGVIVQAPNFAWEDLDLVGRVHTASGLAVHVANDANLASIAECAFGDGDDGGLLLITIGHGVGGGVLVDGRSLNGPLLSSGEIGHIVVDPEGSRCACGNRGCLETSLSAPALRRAGSDAERAAVGTRLGSVLAPVVTTLGIADVVLYGPGALLDGALLQATREALASQSLPFVARRIHVRVVPDEAELVLTGAAAHVRFCEMGVV